ncbi:hypothetical protein GCM10010193_41010 [Kitasatospora atroaurantiaca]|uniref:Uncharacterized protein n=1 Tax=Kitasatospora atroaurantiaca TaxID=285545 RepID=A0A561F1H5_9ACTN|nr:hypothetical protein [Kitasatospora atroaurantiaca]TWE21672.1 hypothetical protein FB465_6870 [Kitasatospora atroaurantiaca]
MTGQHHQDGASRSFEGPYDGAGDDLFEGRSAPHEAGHEPPDPEAGPDDLFWNRSPHHTDRTGPSRLREDGDDER